MSKGARIMLGVALLACAAGFLALVPWMEPVSPQAGPGMAFLGLFCALGATACFWRSSHPVTIRAIGAVVFAACLWYAVSQARAFAADPGLEQGLGPRRGKPSLINSLLFMGLVGLPAGYAALTGRYPGWGSHSKAFGAGGRR